MFCNSLNLLASPPPVMSTTQEEEATLNIRGLGHSLSIHISPLANVTNLFQQIQSLTGLPPAYQRVIIRGKTLSLETSPNTSTLQSIIPSIQPQTTSKAILMHTKTFKLDQKAYEQITSLNHDLDNIESRLNVGTSPSKGDSTSMVSISERILDKSVLDHLVTDIMCKLDLIDVGTSDTLRNMRRKVLQRAEAMDKLWDGSNNCSGEEEKEKESNSS